MVTIASLCRGDTRPPRGSTTTPRFFSARETDGLALGSPGPRALLEVAGNRVPAPPARSGAEVPARDAEPIAADHGVAARGAVRAPALAVVHVARVHEPQAVRASDRSCAGERRRWCRRPIELVVGMVRGEVQGDFGAELVHH